MDQFSESQDEIPILLKRSDKISKDYDNSYKAKTRELFNIFFLYFSRTETIKFPIKYLFYIIELLQMLSFAFYPQVYTLILLCISKYSYR